MHDQLAIQIRDVSKIYKLFGSRRDHLVDTLGLTHLGIKTKSEPKEFVALNRINLDVSAGHRVGIVGRNGAGKTTLLKLLCGNFAATSGQVRVNGNVQALMSVGLGFHPEYTGRENVLSSLQYNYLNKSERLAAVNDVIEFCELGDFLDQPFKTYSLGMQARLMFATATAIKPEILIVDEVLGAGDAYFVTKSKARIEKLINSGCTMLLVSHSMQQILELCNEAIWLDQGEIRMRGDAFRVVKAYEQFIHGGEMVAQRENQPVRHVVTKKRFSTNGELDNSRKLQHPVFEPHSQEIDFPESDALALDNFNFVAPGGVSRWKSSRGVKLHGFTMGTDGDITNKLIALRPARFVFGLQAEETRSLAMRIGVLVHDVRGVEVTRIWSPVDTIEMQEGDRYQSGMVLNPLQIGPGIYSLGVSVVEGTALEQVNHAVRYDLLDRSFEFEISMPDSLSVAGSAFIHSAEWTSPRRIL